MTHGFLPLKSIPNIRELGGIRLPGGTVRRGLLLRGGSLGDASSEDISTLQKDYRLRCIFDFRTEGEVARKPDREVPGATNIWLPTIDPETDKLAGASLPKEAYTNLGPWLSAHAGEPLVQSVASRLYTDMVMNEYSQIQYAAFLQTILQTDGGAIFWHCSQGKDRTGLGAAFLLAALGADRETIMEDYLVSAEYYRNELSSLLPEVSTEEERTVLRTFISVHPPYFEAALDLIDRNYGSLDEYLSGPLCLSESDRETLKSRYLE